MKQVEQKVLSLLAHMLGSMRGIASRLDREMMEINFITDDGSAYVLKLREQPAASTTTTSQLPSGASRNKKKTLKEERDKYEPFYKFSDK